VYNNILRNNTAGIGLAVENGADYPGSVIEDFDIFNNLMYNNIDGMRVAGFTMDGNGAIRNIRIFNNIFNNNSYINIDIGNAAATAVDNVSLINNIFANGHVLVHAGSNIGFDHNIFFNADGGKGTNYLMTDPKFVNPAIGDFHLQSTSPAIDKGSSSKAPCFDFEWKTRPIGMGYDIGAYEYPGNGFISGFVLNNSMVISDAFVITNKSNTITTDSYGFYSLLIPVGTYNLTVTKEPEFYSNTSVIVTAIYGTTIMQDIELIRKPTGKITGRVTS
jgi:hypothetical protein